MSKIGILSMQRIKNYGSFLQAFALKTIIEELGHEVEFVDYHVESPIVMNEAESKTLRVFSKVADVIKGEGTIKQKLSFIKHKKNFNEKYNKYLSITERRNYNPQLDVLVIGSDEVFNCIQSNTNVGYSLELFGKDNNAKKTITYAASFGNTTLEKIEKYGKKAEIGNLLNNITSISVRDNNSGEIVKSLTNKDIEYNLDPVLIFDYMNYIQKQNLDINLLNNEKYILIYAYSGRIKKEESNQIKKYASEHNLKIYTIGGVQSCADKFIDCSPFEVFEYFKNAEFIITDTFHGSIFSIVTHKTFLTLVRKSSNGSYGNEEKLTDLLKRLDLESQMVYDLCDIDSHIHNEIDYDKVEKLISIERDKTKKYLEKNLCGD